MVIERYTARKEILSEVCQVEVSRIQTKGDGRGGCFVMLSPLVSTLEFGSFMTYC